MVFTRTAWLGCDAQSFPTLASTSTQIEHLRVSLHKSGQLHRIRRNGEVTTLARWRARVHAHNRDTGPPTMIQSRLISRLRRDATTIRGSLRRQRMASNRAHKNALKGGAKSASSTGHLLCPGRAMPNKFRWRPLLGRMRTTANLCNEQPIPREVSNLHKTWQTVGDRRTRFGSAGPMRTPCFLLRVAQVHVGVQ